MHCFQFGAEFDTRIVCMQQILNKFDKEQTKDSMSEEFDQYRFLDNIFQNSALTVFKETKVKFGCSCKRKTLLYTLSKYPKAQLEEMCNKKEKISANCQFCGRKFQFSLKQILDYYEG